ncbi:MAG: Glu-tRNA(Gln) amidotransferase subunit GatE, partial [Candidatus Methanofastidiosa archaeon]|nr:Glu-tRNA(Gln) amidotransferase subunit GatE [Candidatus Methanofastidiosa archaeon]
MDYEELGLKVGLEIHAQLDTRKLFCSCPSSLNENHDYLFKRRLRPTMSELGEIDPAAREEFTKGMMNIYNTSLSDSCLVYSDEEPPHDPNPDAIHILLQISALLKADIVDQIQFMRKIVIDGSNVSGFQRTALVALNGKASSRHGDVLIPTICLEEDAARLIEKVGKSRIWNIDRLGTPLVEIATDPSMHHPEQARDVALFLGQAMKSTGRLKRGIGTIRQDVNISIENGARVEVKGVQELNLIEDYVRNEAHRQLALVKIKEELGKRGALEVPLDIIDFSEIFSGTDCKIISGSVFGVKLPGFAGLLKKEVQKGRRFGTELADYARKHVRGIFHSDELPAYGICEDEVSKVAEAIDSRDDDAFVLVAADKETAYKALSEVVRRANMALEGVPKETRRPLADGNTQYMRPLPGRSRMYPETDVYPFMVSRELIEDVMNNLPELPEERLERLKKDYSLSEDNALKIIDLDIEDIFIMSQTKFHMPTGKFLRLFDTITMLSRQGISISIDNGPIVGSFMGEHDRIPLESYEDVLRYMASNGPDVSNALKELGIAHASDEEVRKVIIGIINDNIDVLGERGMDSFKPLMGKAMAELKGKSDGSVISRILRDEL